MRWGGQAYFLSYVRHFVDCWFVVLNGIVMSKAVLEEFPCVVVVGCFAGVVVRNSPKAKEDVCVGNFRVSSPSKCGRKRHAKPDAPTNQFESERGLATHWQIPTTPTRNPRRPSPTTLHDIPTNSTAAMAVAKSGTSSSTNARRFPHLQAPPISRYYDTSERRNERWIEPEG
jgi:hypothetical protein